MRVKMSMIKTIKQVRISPRRVETCCGRIAMIGMYNLAVPPPSIVYPAVQIVSTIAISSIQDSRCSRLSFIHSFEPPDSKKLSYTLTFSPEQETINGRVAMLGFFIFFLFGFKI